MARSCTELLEPLRYALGAPNFLFAQAQLAFPGEPPGESHLVACGLLDLTGTTNAAASVALQEAALIEGKTSRHLLTTPKALHDAHQLAATARAMTFNCVVAIGGWWRWAGIALARKSRIPTTRRATRLGGSG